MCLYSKGAKMNVTSITMSCNSRVGLGFSLGLSLGFSLGLSLGLSLSCVHNLTLQSKIWPSSRASCRAINRSFLNMRERIARIHPSIYMNVHPKYNPWNCIRREGK